MRIAAIKKPKIPCGPEKIINKNPLSIILSQGTLRLSAHIYK